jgi:hypothetical protein
VLGRGAMRTRTSMRMASGQNIEASLWPSMGIKLPKDDEDFVLVAVVNQRDAFDRGRLTVERD